MLSRRRREKFMLLRLLFSFSIFQLSHRLWSSRRLLQFTVWLLCEEFAGSSLCFGRPEPEYYDPLYLSWALKGNMFVLIRPDHFINSQIDVHFVPEVRKYYKI